MTDVSPRLSETDISDGGLRRGTTQLSAKLLPDGHRVNLRQRKKKETIPDKHEGKEPGMSEERVCKGHPMAADEKKCLTKLKAASVTALLSSPPNDILPFSIPETPTAGYVRVICHGVS